MAEISLPKGKSKIIQKRPRRSFSLRDKLQVVEKIIAGDLDPRDVRDTDGVPIHYGVVEKWVLDFQAGKLRPEAGKNGEESPYVRRNVRQPKAVAKIPTTKGIAKAKDQKKTMVSEEVLKKLVQQEMMDMLQSMAEEGKLNGHATGKVKKPAGIDSIQRKVLNKTK